MRGTRMWVMALGVAAMGCAGSARLRAARTAAYQTELDQVWAGVVNAVREDFPLVKELSRKERRIVTCWRPIDREALGNWYLFRAVIEVSPEPPYRVSVSGRAAEYRAPQVYPIAHGDVMEPGWVDGRTDRMRVQVFDRLSPVAVTASGQVPPATDPGEAENVAETCILRAEELGVAANNLMSGIAIGDPGALGALPRQP